MRVNLYFYKEFVDKLKEKAKAKGLSMSAYIRVTFIEKWNEEEKGE